MPPTRRQRSSSRRSPTDAHLNNLTTQVLRLRLDQLKLVSTGTRSVLLARLKAALSEQANHPTASSSSSQPGPQASTSQDNATDSSDVQHASVANETPPSAAFTPEQLSTLKSLITSSLQEVIPLFTSPTNPQEPPPPPQLTEPEISPPVNSLATHLPGKVVTAIRNGEYVDLNCLLPENVDGHDDNLRISLDTAGGSSLSIPVSVSHQKRLKIDSIERWLTAFNIFASVVVHFFPYKASQLFAYQQLIRESQRKFSGLAWYAYDIAFRKRAAIDKSLSWAHRDTQLYLEKFTGLAKTVCHTCGSAEHFANSCPIAPPRLPRPQPTSSDICRNYNRNQPCITNPCRFKHRCNRPDCDGHHPAVEHVDKPQSQDHSKRSRR